MTDSRLRPNSPTRVAAPDARAAQLVEGLGARPTVDIVIPRTQTRAKLRLLSRHEMFEAESDARKMLAAAGFPVDVNAVTALGGSTAWEYERGVRVIALAVLDPKTGHALAPCEDWREECDDDQIAALYTMYRDLEEHSDPLGERASGLTDAEFAALEAAVKKKDRDLLMSYGSSKLASYVITSAERLASSPTPTS